MQQLPISNPNTSSPLASCRDAMKKEDGLLAYYFSAQIANGIVRVVAKTSFKPNHFTALSVLLGVVAAYLFSRGNYSALLWGVLVLHLSFIFDCCDGQLARCKGLITKLGHWFDYHTDKLKDGVLLFGFALGAYRQENISWIFAVAFVAIFFQFLRNITALNRDIFKFEQHGSKDASHFVIQPTSQNQFLRSLKHSLLFKLADRVLLYTVFGLLNLAKEGIILYAVLEVFYATMSARINYKYFSRVDKEKEG